MNLITPLVYKNASIGQQASVLDTIHQSEINIAIYQRDTTALKEELDMLMVHAIEFRKSGTPNEINAALQQYMADKSLACPAVLEDIERQLDLFKRITGEAAFRMLLTAVNTNMCRRFHTDINIIRLLCTYVGQGTMWLPNDQVNDKAFLTQGGNEEIVKDERHIQQVNTGDVLLLKGALYPDGTPIVHRSPTIEETGETRLLLRIDIDNFLNL
ncbi:MAG: DUF1826 domain-containing protein [Bacteroidota bacterium]